MWFWNLIVSGMFAVMAGVSAYFGQSVRGGHRRCYDLPEAAGFALFSFVIAFLALCIFSRWSRAKHLDK